MAYVRLIFNDDQDNEQFCMCFSDTSGPARLAAGDLIQPDKVQVGQVVYLPDRSVRRVDAVEIGA